MNEEIWNRLTMFVNQQIAPGGQMTLTGETRLVEDLGLVGDEADDFMGEFAGEFGVAAGDFNFDRYFPPEGFNPLAAIGNLFVKNPRAQPLQPLTLGMLERAARLGEWRSAEIESAE